MGSGISTARERERVRPACATTTPIKVAASHAEAIDGRKLAQASLDQIKGAVDGARSGSGARPPTLVVVLVGENPASLSYIKQKQRAAVACGVVCELRQLDASVTQQGVVDVVEGLNKDAGVDGVIVQLPLPAHINAAAMTELVAHAKDVDGFTKQSIGSVALSGIEPWFCPCTPKGCIDLIKSTGVALRGKEAVVIGASNIVGVPVALLLIHEGCTVTVCHIDTQDTVAHSRKADILVVAVGKAGLVQKHWVKPGAVVIDVGINFVPDATKKSGKRMVGDCSPGVAEVAGHLTPVPGGVGPMTVASLMRNTAAAWERTLAQTQHATT